MDQNFIVEKAKSLQHKLMEFGIPVSVEGFDIGPSIVQIKIKPSEGIKISSIENLANDIKLSLKSKSLRIVAPIPGTDSVGIQIPNPQPSMVRIGDILNSGHFQEAMKKSETGLALGKGIDGSIEVKTLESMPHLLVAGATGSGKSVGINDFIVSLMFQNTPSELKFLMVDPKQVELEMYSGLPYMLAPIVYDSTKAIKLLQWTVQEMERRYTTLKEQRVKNLTEYNTKNPAEKMYRIVFVIDEMADMMISSSANRKEVENCINRLAAKARAVGIHLILATQRPSVNVITGLIKANIPTRIAFGVVSEVDSRTILGRKGAEDLVGKGDMLYMDPSTKFPIRIQAPFVATEEIEKVVDTLKRKYMQGLTEEDIYNPEIIAALESKVETGVGAFSGGTGDEDDLIDQAIQVIAETRKASATLLQRKL
ncbi:MAG: DNA translocase FtsK [Candidatus Peribacteria bacterium]|nr:DNA translocase FtsK [Candidatus Peribacteria bacterium]